jgi:tRNA (guanine10-N2)-dimethyltransferase
MRLLCELSKEYDDLPFDEILSVLTAERISYHMIHSSEDALIFECDVTPSILQKFTQRLALTFHINEYLFSCPSHGDDLRKCATEYPFKKKGSLSVKYRNRSQHIPSQRIVKTLADVYTKDTRVDLEHPDHEIRVLITDQGLYVGVKIIEVDRKQFEERKVQHRPFFSPISIHPKLARTLVNLSMISTDETLLDPFCGTGGILIEAGLVNAKLVGNDVEEKIIEGCQRNLEFYDIHSYDLFCADIGELPQYIDTVDAIVTDLPYGKSTTTKGENLDQLYHRSFEVFAMLLKKQGRAVICQPSKTIQSIATRYFSLVKQYELRVHRSLTRYISVYQN